MQPIQPLWGADMPLTLRTVPQPEQTVVPFTDVFQSAVQAVKETDAEKNQVEYLTATGQIDNPALLTIALSKASLSVDLLLQLRTKAMDAYNELIRISL